ncbi:hypothetical protein JQ032_16185 [Clostridium botulinum]|nr:hypothetical protein [Clostridium botulinum]
MTDIASLKNCSKLKELYLFDNKVIDITPLKNFEKYIY